MALPGVARPLCVLRAVEQLPGVELVPRTGPAPLVSLASAAQPAAADLGRLQRSATAFLTPHANNHAPVREAASLIGVTFGKSRMRESRTYGSVRAKPNGRATRPPPHHIYAQLPHT